MSRSRKKTPRSGDKKKKYFKKYANHRLRQYPLKALPLNYGAYKKHYSSWNICDYEIVGTSFEEYWVDCLTSWYNWKQYYDMEFPDRE